jgi:hypothetical protein
MELTHKQHEELWETVMDISEGKLVVSNAMHKLSVLLGIGNRLIDKVTVDNLDIALRMCDIKLDKMVIDKIIDIVEIIEDKGDDVTIKDMCQLQSEWEEDKTIIDH